jgi:hypothetical protein
MPKPMKVKIFMDTKADVIEDDARAQSSPPSDNPDLENPTERRRVDL